MKTQFNIDVTEDGEAMPITRPSEEIKSMSVPADDYFSLVDASRTVKSFAAYLSRRWWVLLVLALAGAVIGFAYYKFQKPKYEAVCTFILEEKSSSGGGLAGLASQFGINVGGLGGGSIFSGDNILEILKSKKVVEKVLLSKVDNEKVNETLADYYLDFTGKRKSWDNSPTLFQVKFSGEEQPLSPLQDSILNIIYENIVKKGLSTERTNKQGTIIKVQVSSENGLFSRLVTERLVQEASKLYLDLRTGTALDNIRQLQLRSDSLLILLNGKSYRAAASQPLDINPGLRTAIVPVEIANRDKTVLATLYAEVTKNLEASKMLLAQQTPVIQLLDRPGILLNDNKKGPIFLMTIGIVALVLCYVTGAFATFILSRLNSGQKS